MTDEKPKAPAKKKVIKPYKPAAKFCPRCGCRLADHADRLTCGRCSYMELKSKTAKK